jgi:hypothetical protein
MSCYHNLTEFEVNLHFCYMDLWGLAGSPTLFAANALLSMNGYIEKTVVLIINNEMVITKSLQFTYFNISIKV